MNSCDYLNNFKDKEKALKLAHKIRIFEIKLYWKRTTYFWTLTAFMITGFFTLNINSSNELFLILISSCIGFFFSLGWYFVNRGSRYWYLNWEKHIDCLENEIIGPLYKLTLDGNYKIIHLISPYKFSPSKINTILSLFIVLIWIILLQISIYNYIITINGIYCKAMLSFIINILFLLISCFVFIRFSKTNIDYNDEKIFFKKRRVSCKTE